MHAFTRELLEYLNTIPVIDTHEHLPDETARLKQSVDFTTLFSHYCRDDLAAAGMTAAQDQVIFGSAPVEQKWSLIQPLLERTQTSAYMRAAYLAMERFYGFSTLKTAEDAAEVTRRIRQANQAGLYKAVLQEACGIRRSMNFTFEGRPEDRQLFGWVPHCSGYASLCHMNEVLALEKQWDAPLPTLERYTKTLLDAMESNIQQGMDGIKFSLAYNRPLDFTTGTQHEAELVYNRLFSESRAWQGHGLGYLEARPLENYIVRKLIEFAGDNNLPVIMHVGFQTGPDMRLEDARPHHLWETLRRYRHTRFAMLHGGLPWVEEGAVMARQLTNLTIDMGWMHIMCPELAERALHCYVDMVPCNKVMGFGGDYLVVEKVYGHLQIARQNMAMALGSRVDSGRITLEQAKRWGRWLLHDAANGFYNLGFEQLSE